VILGFSLANNPDSDASTPAGLSALGAVPVALLVVGIGASLGGPTGYAINPARDLGPRIAHAFLPIKGKGGSDWSYAWVPVVGPVIGGLLAGLASYALLPIL
jgi:glycerol uptake facilitator protein